MRYRNVQPGSAMAFARGPSVEEAEKRSLVMRLTSAPLRLCGRLRELFSPKSGRGNHPDDEQSTGWIAGRVWWALV